jgi:hypothetical protein
MNFKRYLLLVFALITPTLALAGHPYIAPTLLLQQLSASNTKYRGLQPKIAFGYATFRSIYYFAGEFFINPPSITLSDERTGGSSTRPSRGYGVSVLPGRILTPFLYGYARLGIIATHGLEGRGPVRVWLTGEYRSSVASTGRVYLLDL